MCNQPCSLLYLDALWKGTSRKLKWLLSFPPSVQSPMSGTTKNKFEPFFITLTFKYVRYLMCPLSFSPSCDKLCPLSSTAPQVSDLSFVLQSFSAFMELLTQPQRYSFRGGEGGSVSPGLKFFLGWQRQHACQLKITDIVPIPHSSVLP